MFRVYVLLEFKFVGICRHSCFTITRLKGKLIIKGKGNLEDVSLMEFMYLVFACIPCESYRRRLRSLLDLCYVFRALINSLEASDLV